MEYQVVDSQSTISLLVSHHFLNVVLHVVGTAHDIDIVKASSGDMGA